MMAQTVSVHNGNSGTVSQEHNARDAEYIKNHVNQEGVIEGGYYRTIIHEPKEEAINRIFASALEEYNAKKRADVKHPGREIDDYYKHLASLLEENKKRKSVDGNKSGYEVMQPCYEVILQIGNIDTVNCSSDSDYDTDRLDPRVAEEILLEAINRVKEKFIIPAVDREGRPILDEDGNQKMWTCIEIIGLYVHDDEKLKGIHAHLDYIPVAHNYKRGLSMQPGLTKALEEMGLRQDRLEDLSKDRTRLMMERFGIEYHDSDYMDANGKQIPKSELTDEQKLHRKLASELVPCRTPQMKLQDMFRDSIREVMTERGIPIADIQQSNRDHSDKRSWAEIMEQVAANKQSKEIHKELSGKIKTLKSDIEMIEEKRSSLINWDKRPKSEKELMKQVNEEVKDMPNIIGPKMKLVPDILWNNLLKLLKGYFRLEAENNKLRASTGIQKVREANAVINKRDSIIDAAESKAKDIITEAESVRIRSKLLKENHELRSELDIYRSAADRNPGFMKAVEQEMRGKETHRVSETSR